MSDDARGRSTERRLISVIVPVYEEAATLRELLDRVRDAPTEAIGFDKEIIVSDDGSTDDTLTIALLESERDARIRLVRGTRHRGKGYAIRSALEVAQGDYCVIQDADLEYDPSSYVLLLERARAGAPIVYGSRFLWRSWPQGMRAPNWFANRLLTAAANLLYRIAITDEATCLKLFETGVLRSFELVCTGFDFCPEVTAKAALHDVGIAEIPVPYVARSSHAGKKVRWIHAVEALWVLAKLRWSPLASGSAIRAARKSTQTPKRPLQLGP